MMSSLFDIVLFFALVATSAVVMILYRKLKVFETRQADFRKAFADTGAALASAQEAVGSFGADGRELLVVLSNRIDEARSVVAHLEHLENRLNSRRSTAPAESKA